MSFTTRGRQIYSTFERGKLSIKYHAEVSDDITCAHKCQGCLFPCSCMCDEELSKAVKESTYVQVLENRIEYNYPSTYVTCSFPDIWRLNCHVVDNVGVIYYDRAIAQHAAKAEPCSPCCTHNSCSPTNCGLCGESMVLYETVPGMCAFCGSSCSHPCTCCHIFNVGVNAPGIVNRHCCAAQHVMFHYVKDASGLATAINETRHFRLKSQGLEVEMEMMR